MPCALSLPLDDRAAHQVMQLRHRLAEAGWCGDTGHAAGPPHLTLAITDQPDDEAVFCQVAHDLVSRWRPVSLQLAYLGLFPNALFWGPVVTAELLRHHAEAVQALAGCGLRAEYQPGCWVPHVTLIKTLSDAATVWPDGLAVPEPMIGTLHSIEVIRFRPIEWIARHPLSVGRSA
jgi:2'-5' RNA ligase